MRHNQFGEVVSVNGLTTGHHLGTPMQDTLAVKPEDNEAYAIERNTRTRLSNSDDTWENQPKPSKGGVTSWNDLTDRPFGYIEYGDPITLVDGDVEITNIPEMGFAVNLNPIEVPIAALNEEDVVQFTIDGNVYNLTACFDPVYARVYVGNPSFTGGQDNGIPFAMSVAQNMINIMLRNYETGTYHITVVCKQAVIHKVQEKWLNRSPVYLVEVSADGETCNRTAREIDLAARLGQVPMLIKPDFDSNAQPIYYFDRIDNQSNAVFFRMSFYSSEALLYIATVDENGNCTVEEVVLSTT